jgi:hypothetical protein
MRVLPALLLLLSSLLSAVSIEGPATLRGTVGVPLVAAVRVSGATTSLYFDLSPAIPGLSINHGTGRITGSPTTATTEEPISVTLTASYGGSAVSASLSVTIDAASTAAKIVNASEWAVTADSFCSLQLVTDVAATGFLCTGMPDAMTVSPEGLLSGQASTPGLYNLDVSADGGTTATTLLLEVLTAQAGVPSFTLAVQPQASIGAPFAVFLSASVTDVITSTTTAATSYACNSRPTWLSLDPVSGLLSGTPPTATPSTNLRLSASLGGSTASTVLAIPIAVPAVGDPLPASPAVIEATESSGLGWKATASAPATWSASGLPAGLDIDANSGQLTGTPLAAGNVSALITATPIGVALPLSTTIALRVRAASPGAPVLPTQVPPVLTAGAPAAIAILTEGGVPRSFSRSGSADFSIDGTGLLSGTPMSAGTQVVTISATNANGTAIATLMLEIGPRVVAAPLPTAPVAFHVTAGSRFASILIADGPVSTWTGNGRPDWLALDPYTGRLTGLAEAGTSNVFFSASDPDGSNPTNGAILGLAATTRAPVISDAGPWQVGAGQPVRLQLIASATPTWTIRGLPTGLTATSGGTISGMASAAGSRNLDLIAANDSGQARTSGLLIVEAATPGTSVFSDPGLLTGVVGVPFTGQLAASLNPLEYAISGGPAWLAVTPNSGALSGTPTADGTWLLEISVRNAVGTVRTLTILRVGSGPTSSDKPVSAVSGGGCGAGAAGLLLALLGVGLRRRHRA